MGEFPSRAHQFRPGGPGGPGRPRKHPVKIRGTPWLDIRQPGADIDALAAQWAAMIRQHHHTAFRQLLELADVRPGTGAALEARIRSALRSALRPARPVPSHPARSGLPESP